MSSGRTSMDRPTTFGTNASRSADLVLLCCVHSAARVSGVAHMTTRSWWRRVSILGSFVALVALATPAAASSSSSRGATSSSGSSSGIHKIKHVVVIMQENRSFDSYFGTFPGAEGIPMANGTPTACVPDPATGTSLAPFPDHAHANGGGPHNYANATGDINGGRMDGFIGQAESGKKGCSDPTDPACTNAATPDVMGYHTQSDIPNYWAYANNFVLQDHMFEPNASLSLPAHLFMVSELAAYCSRPGDPMSCVNALQAPTSPKSVRQPDYAWTDLTYLLHKAGVSWRYYVFSGTES